MMDEQGYDEETAEAVCGSLEQEAKAEHGDARQLLESIREAGGMILDAAIDLNSAVEVPAIDSRWVAMKSASDEQGDTRIESQFVLKQDRDGSEEEKRISYAPAMIPREIDKEGDLVPTPVVEQAAHDYLKNDGGIDTDHNLIEGKGEVVESWIEPDERTWDLPDGGTETYPAGTWMLGIEWQAEPWERIKSGELTGLSIYGSAEQVTLKGVDECDCPNVEAKSGDSYKETNDDSANNGTMADETNSDTEEETKDGPSIETLAESINEMQDTLQTVTDELKSETEEDEEKQEDAKEAAAVLADEYGVETGAVLEALESLANEEDEDEEDEDMEESKAKDETAKHKGHDGEGVRDAETAEKQASSVSDRTSFAELAKETAEGR